MNISFSQSDVALGAVLACRLLNVPFKWGSKSELPVTPTIFLSSSHLISRHVARSCQEMDLYPANTLHRSEVDHWLSLSTEPLNSSNNLPKFLDQLNTSLAPSNFLVSDNLTLADLEVFAALYKNAECQSKFATGSCPSHVLRWYNYMKHKLNPILSSLPNEVKSALSQVSTDTDKATSVKREEGGKFVDLPGAKMGEVVVRFPPEASGYLHIGHAKAALLNQHYQKAFKGKLIMRFDDTNPDKEKADFEKVIIEDLKLLDVEPDIFTFTSDYFEKMLEMCESLISQGRAYVDDTDAEQMKKERDERKESRNRNNTPAVNLKLFEEMKKGTDKGLQCCVRAKIDMSSNNGCMRDPTIYRCKNEPHPRKGNKYKVYPTYDFACPIVDSIEGVTHALRTTEYHDRDEQFFWFIENLNLRSLHIYEYSRLNMNNTVLSKRKLTWFVSEGLVDGWDDPRFPTVRGIMRRGMTVEGLKDFILAQGSSRSVVNMEWDKIWAFNKKVIDREASRYTALEGDLVPVEVSGCQVEAKQAQKHPKDPSKGNKTIWVGPKVWIERADSLELKEGQNATFINWGNLRIVKIHQNNQGNIERVEAQANLSDTDYKKTVKVTWLSETNQAPWTPLVCSYFGHLITKSVLGKDEDFKNFVNHSTRKDVQMRGDDDLKHLKVGDIIQIQRKGFFRVDETYKPFSPATCKETPVVLIYIPDGHSKDSTNLSSTNSASQTKAVKESRKESFHKPSSSNVIAIHDQIKQHGDKIRQLKAEKLDKNIIMTEVDVLKSLKANFKEQSGLEWTPDLDIGQFHSTNVTKSTEKSVSSNDARTLHKKIKEVGDKIRELKDDKAEKDVIKGHVDSLLALKKEYKDKTGIDWKPDIDIQSITGSSTGVPSGEDSSNPTIDILNQIKKQGDKIRDMKASKADKNVIKSEVDLLLSLKAKFREVSGLEWKPDIDINKFSNVNGTKNENNLSISPIDENITASNSQKIIDLNNQIKTQGDKIRTLKSSKADKDAVKAEVNILLDLKANFKNISGQEWKPDVELSALSSESKSVSQSASTNPTSLALDVHNKIKEQGDKVRSLKSQKADKETITARVNILLELKKEFKNLTNIEWKPDINPSTIASSVSKDKSQPPPSASSKAKSTGTVAKDNKPKEAKVAKTDDSSSKKQTRLGLEAKKEENLADWYSQVITKAEMIEYYNVSGCYILRPWSYCIWEKIKDFLDKEIKKLGVENAYFPLFVSKDALEKEKSHLEDFSPEVAWVTRSGSSEMAEPVAIRPTSETVMYPAFAKWVQSHRDLPIKINQWNNVVRWEFKQPTPFLRTREFLWQEGHTAFATKEEACDEVYTIADIYARVYGDLLAIPVVKGKKTNKEKFAGADFTITTEAFVSASGRGIQGATSHHLGQNFAKMVDIVFEDPKTQEKKYVYQNSWGLTTRTIGVMVMVHGDDKGLVLPPVVAPIQVVVMPVGITASTSEAAKNCLLDYCTDISNVLNEREIRTKCDFRDHVTPAWKFNHWELKGVPVRLEIGPRELTENKVFAVRRDSGEKESLDRMFIERRIFNLLETIHSDMFAKAKMEMDTHTVKITQWPDFVNNLNSKNLLMSPFCGEEECEDEIKKNSARDEPSDSGAPAMGAKSLCIPFDQPGPVDGLKCINPKCTKKSEFFTIFGRSY